MTPRTLKVLEYDKILARVAERCAFSGGADIATALLPTDEPETAQRWLSETAEAARLLEQKTEIGFGGARDVRPLLAKGQRGSSLMPSELLETKNTLMRARSLRNLLLRLDRSFPRLAEIAEGIEPLDHVVNEIGRAINDRGEVVDSASAELSRIRQQLRVAQERLLSTLDRLTQNSDIRPYLQDAIVTQRQGRYVIPVRAESKGQVNGIVHDQSASGATLFVEPLAVVQQNNAVRELELDEEKEVRRILRELTQSVVEEAPYVQQTVEILALLDFTFAKAKYALDLNAMAPEIVPFRQPREISHQSSVTSDQSADAADSQPATHNSQPVTPIHPGSVIDLRGARHPLLDQDNVVPITTYLDENYYLVVITGPNTGGKTVTLKTVGLLLLMAQSGLMIPAEPGSKLSVFDGIYADIGDEQSIEQNLSTFSGHLTNIIAMLEEADPQSLVLFDELGAGTDPDEGSALAMALLENLRDRGITTFATTHYSDLKLYAHNTPGVRNASVEFDVETLSPTYELSMGLPGRSNALTIARRLGLNPTIVDRAENIVRPDTLEADALLDDIKRAKQEAARAEGRAKARERSAQVVESDLRYQLAGIEEARRAVIAETRETMQAELAEAREEIERARRQLARGEFGSAGNLGASTHDDFLARAADKLSRREEASQAVNRQVAVPGDPEERIAGDIEVGDRVWVSSLQASGEVLSINQRSEEADVQLGNFRLKLPLARLELRQKAQKERAPAPAIAASSYAQFNSDVPSNELDLRGERAEEGRNQLDRYLDRAATSRLPWVRIIHGKGTGAMRNAVQDLLRGHPLVSEFRAGAPGEGGDGVTVVKFVEG